MNQIFEEQLKILNNNRLLMEALYQVLFKRIESERPQIGETNSDKILGEKFRAYEKAKSILEGFFTDIKSFNELKVNNKEFNKEQ